VDVQTTSIWGKSLLDSSSPSRFDHSHPPSCSLLPHTPPQFLASNLRESSRKDLHELLPQIEKQHTLHFSTPTIISRTQAYSNSIHSQYTLSNEVISGAPNTHRWISALTPSRDLKEDSRRTFLCRLISNFALPKDLQYDLLGEEYQNLPALLSRQQQKNAVDTVAVVRNASLGLLRAWNSSRGNTMSIFIQMNFVIGLLTWAGSNRLAEATSHPVFPASHLWE
jgi:hypothetical protein